MGWSGAGPPASSACVPDSVGPARPRCSHHPPSRAGEASPRRAVGAAGRAGRAAVCLPARPAVEECQLDENSMLIPIAVGGALAGLVLIVLLAYLIGRKRSHAGYQTI